MCISIRAEPECRFTPVLLLTTEARKDIKGKAKRQVQQAGLVKPFNPNTFKKVLG